MGEIAASVHRALEQPDGSEPVKLLGLPALPNYINGKQRHRILARRRCKVKMQTARVLAGFVEGGQVKHASRQEHARRRVRGPQGRFMGSSEREAHTSTTSSPIAKTINKTTAAAQEGRHDLLRRMNARCAHNDSEHTNVSASIQRLKDRDGRATHRGLMRRAQARGLREGPSPIPEDEHTAAPGGAQAQQGQDKSSILATMRCISQLILEQQQTLQALEADYDACE